MFHATDTIGLDDAVTLGTEDLSITVSLGNGCTTEVTLYQPADEGSEPLVVLQVDEWPITAAGAPPRRGRRPRRSARTRCCRVRPPDSASIHRRS
jgi:hypothetical protein